MRGKTRTRKIRKFKIKKTFFPILILVTLVITFFTATYTIINHYAIDIVNNYMTELISHDKVRIQNYISNRFEYMVASYDDLKRRKPQETSELLDELKILCTTNNASLLYLIDQDGNLYSSEGEILSRDDNPFLEYNTENNNKEFYRYDDCNNYQNIHKEYMLYCFDFSDSPITFSDDTPTFVTMIMLRDIIYLRTEMRITCFDNRGYTSIVDDDGTFVVSDASIGTLGEIQNCFDLLKNRPLEKIKMEEITEKFNNREPVSFWYTDSKGVRKYVLFSPIEDSQWTFLTSIEESVYADQLNKFVNLIVYLTGGLFIICLVGFALLRHSHKALNAFYSSVAEGVRSRQYYNAKIADNEVMSLAIVDIDHLKWINDTFGHTVGDEAIRKMAMVLTNCAGHVAEICRFGGDEFVVAFLKESDKLEFEEIINRMLLEVRNIRLDDYPDFKMTFSVGAFHGKGIANEVFIKADALLYEAKKTRDRAVLQFEDKKIV